MTQHFTKGAIKEHYEDTHRTRPTHQELLNNTNILRKFHTRDKLMLYEALYIKEIKPYINKKDEGITHTLKIF